MQSWHENMKNPGGDLGIDPQLTNKHLQIFHWEYSPIDPKFFRENIP